jgi:hypothetical protein
VTLFAVVISNRLRRECEIELADWATVESSKFQAPSLNFQTCNSVLDLDLESRFGWARMKAEEDSRTPRPGGSSIVTGFAKRLGLRLSSAALDCFHRTSKISADLSVLDAGIASDLSFNHRTENHAGQIFKETDSVAGRDSRLYTAARDMKTQPIKVIDGPLPPGIWERANMEPRLSAAPELAVVLEELRLREPLFHRPEFGTTRNDFEKMLAPNFWEVSASGRRFSREFILDCLEERYEKSFETVWELGEFCCHQISPDNYMATYTLHQGERVSRRTTIWRRAVEGWQAVYHQGTLVLETK